ncbi:MAG: DUF3575 domain-containing protein [Rikenellaceae bacterium]|jgi:hypothetical protein|nr:DUF3575 domain-containing protein [Rikenellaceae bacterium]
MKKIIILLACLPLLAQAQNRSKSSVYTFKAGDDMFSLEDESNRAEARKFLEVIDERKSGLEDGSLVIFVRGYGEKNTLQLIKTRSNRVKTYFIEKKGLTEEHFSTYNRYAEYKGMANVVVVYIGNRPANSVYTPKNVEPQYVVAGDDADKAAAEQAARDAAARQAAADKAARDAAARQAAADKAARDAADRAAKEAAEKAARDEAAARAAADRAAQQVADNAAKSVKAVSDRNDMFSLRTNLLFWLALSPNLGVEYKPTPKLGIVVDGAVSMWAFNHQISHNNHMWMVRPQVRYYFADNRRWFLGGDFHVGKFDTKLWLTEIGRKGKYIGAGAIGGYKMPLGRSFEMEFGLGLGYTHFEYDRYKLDWSSGQTVRVPAGHRSNKNWYGPTQAEVTLIWDICGGKK